MRSTAFIPSFTAGGVSGGDTRKGPRPRNRPSMPPPLPALDVPRLSPTDRLVGLPALRLADARTGAPPRLSTAVRVGLREGALCVRFDGRDAGVVATLRERDAPLWTEDVFEDFSHARRTAAAYYEFEVNPLGALFDARVESPGLSRASMRVDPAWDCPGLEARVTRREGSGPRRSGSLSLRCTPARRLRSGAPTSTGSIGARRTSSARGLRRWRTRRTFMCPSASACCGCPDSLRDSLRPEPLDRALAGALLLELEEVRLLPGMPEEGLARSTPAGSAPERAARRDRGGSSRRRSAPRSRQGRRASAPPGPRAARRSAGPRRAPRVAPRPAPEPARRRPSGDRRNA